MSVKRVRAVYASGREGDVRIVNYDILDGVQVSVMSADRKFLTDLIGGKDIEFKAISQFSIEGESRVGYFSSKTKEELTDEQREMVYNLVYILAMQRSSIKIP